MTETERDYGLSIQNYIKDNTSICREERQYALYLSNVLRYYKNRLRREEAETFLTEECNKQYGMDAPFVEKEEIRKNEAQIENWRSFLKKVYEICEIPYDDTTVIRDVFYEATFLRDFLERNRRVAIGKKDNHEKSLDGLCRQKSFLPKDYRVTDPADSFNARLILYVSGKIDRNTEEEKLAEQLRTISFSGTKQDNDLSNILRKIAETVEEKNYGNNPVPGVGLSFRAQSLLRAMMKAKPDLAVVYEHKDKNGKSHYYLSFLECKFESDEGVYKYESKSENGKKEVQTFEQRQVQWYIADFLQKSGYLKYTDENGEDVMLEIIGSVKEDKTQKTVKVEFDRGLRGSKDKIEIDKLTRLERHIFEG